jgi:hypothetical protein
VPESVDRGQQDNPPATAATGPGRSTPAGNAVRKMKLAYEASREGQTKIGDPWITRREALALIRWIEARA